MNEVINARSTGKNAYLEVHVPVEISNKEQCKDRVECEEVKEAQAYGFHRVRILLPIAWAPALAWIGVNGGVLEEEGLQWLKFRLIGRGRRH